MLEDHVGKIIAVTCVALVAALVLAAIASAKQEAKWQAMHVKRCAEWMQSARTPYERTQVSMGCEQIAASHDAKKAAEEAQAAANVAAGLAASSAARR